MENIENSVIKEKDSKKIQKQSEDNWLIKLGDLEKMLFMRLLQQKCLTYELILKWMAPNDFQLQHGKRSKLYYRLYRLVKTGYLKKQIIDGQEIYLLTQSGLNAARDLNVNALPLVSVSELETIRHDLLTANIRHYLESHGCMGWVSDREFRLHVDKIPYVPDGACTVATRTIFVEIELSQKSKNRYDKIAEIYTATKGPDRVLYFYQDETVIEYLKLLVCNHPRLGFFRYEDGMSHPGDIVGMCASKEMSLGTFLGIS